MTQATRYILQVALTYMWNLCYSSAAIPKLIMYLFFCLDLWFHLVGGPIASGAVLALGAAALDKNAKDYGRSCVKDRVIPTRFCGKKQKTKNTFQANTSAVLVL